MNAPNVLQLAAILNQQEFGDGSEEATYDENATPAADDLDLKVGNLNSKVQTIYAMLKCFLFTFESLLAGGK